MDWWIWIVAGLFLLLFELMTPGFFFLFFGASALLMGLISVIGIHMGLVWELLVFTVLSVVSLLLFRGPVLRRLKPKGKPRIDRIEDEIAITRESIAQQAVGQIELRGTVWKARNVDDRDLEKGIRCQVTKMDGLTLEIIQERSKNKED